MSPTRDPEQRNRLGSLLHAIAGECRFCGCHGDSCKTWTGEKCDLIGLMQDRCNGIACEFRRDQQQKQEKRKAQREGRRYGKGGGR